MVLADNVAITALVVSVLALYIALFQAIQQVFGSAEGFRRCQESVVGPWASLTRLPWRFQGFRCETKFTAPLIMFLREHLDDGETPAERDEQRPGSQIFFLRDVDHTQLPTGANKFYLWLWTRGLLVWRRAKKGVPYYLVQDILRRTINLRQAPSTRQQADRATWIQLLGAVDELENLRPQSMQALTEICVEVPMTKEYKMPEPKDSNQTFLVVKLVERSWDLVPAEVTRPYAETTVGAMITIVNRLGLCWEAFRPDESVLKASGDCHVISSSELRGLGTLCEYRSFPRKHEDSEKGSLLPNSNKMIPSKHSDMLICGIIPSSFPTINRIKLIGKSRTLGNYFVNKFLERFDFDNDLTEDLATAANFQPSEDNPVPRYFNDPLGLILSETIGIVAPFLPLPDCLDSFIPWPIPHRRPFAVPLFWEGKVALLHRLQNQDTSASIVMQYIKEGMEVAERSFPDDFYCRWDTARGMGHGSNDERRQLQAFCREGHRWTSIILFPGKSDDGSARPHKPGNKDILKWHLHTAANCLPGVKKEWKDKNRLGYLKDYGRGPHCAKFVTELAERYLDRVGEQLDQAETELWWVMMFRSFCWYMSVGICRDQQPVPSVYYENKMPIYIG